MATTDPAGAVAAWSESTLIVPPGHGAAGQPMALPEFAVTWLKEALQPQVREGLLCVGRKNSKSACCAVLMLSFLIGPLYKPGWRGCVVSVNSGKAQELLLQMEQICIAAGIKTAVRATQEGIYFRRQPAPGAEVGGAAGASVQVLASDRTSGHASGYNVCLVDELGILHERDRALLSGLKSSTSARDGKMLSISIRGDAPFVDELLDRQDDPGVVVHMYAPEPDADPMAEATWHSGNPGLKLRIKSISYMRDRARLVKNVPGDLSLFRAEDLNMKGSPTREMIVSVAEWMALDDNADRAGDVVVGIDIGGADSLTAAVLIWPSTGRCEAFAAAGVTDTRTLADRGVDDGVGSRYVQLHEGGELWGFHGARVTPVSGFLTRLLTVIGNHRVLSLGCDRYRKSELLDWMAEAKLSWPLVFRGTGAGSTADGSEDVLAFQKAVLAGWLKPCRGNRLMMHSISESVLTRDARGNAAIERGRRRGRIDALSACVIAASLADTVRSRPPARYRSFVIGDAA